MLRAQQRCPTETSVKMSTLGPAHDGSSHKSHVAERGCCDYDLNFKFYLILIQFTRIATCDEWLGQWE